MESPGENPPQLRRVEILEVVAPNKVIVSYTNRLSECSGIQELESTMAENFENCDKFVPTHKGFGRLQEPTTNVIVRNDDGTCRRGQIINSGPDAEVYLCDYGISTTVKKEEFSKLAMMKYEWLSQIPFCTNVVIIPALVPGRTLKCMGLLRPIRANEWPADAITATKEWFWKTEVAIRVFKEVFADAVIYADFYKLNCKKALSTYLCEGNFGIIDQTKMQAFLLNNTADEVLRAKALVYLAQKESERQTTGTGSKFEAKDETDLAKQLEADVVSGKDEEKTPILKLYTSGAKSSLSDRDEPN